ncbi:MAG: hypothetical protein GXO25_05920 [Euryarchaeota archaeon]|nr:hypothetical protein [Euryarchaeota archaeon]
MKNDKAVEEKGTIQGDPRYRTSAAGRSGGEISALLSERNPEFQELWTITGHWWDPVSVKEKLLFIEGEL